MSINNINGNTALQSGSFPPVRVASTGSPLNPAAGGLPVVDGVQLITGDRVLCKDETSAVANGIYAANTGPWSRTSDASSNQQFFSGMGVTAGLGAVNGAQTFICTCQDDPVVVGNSQITFAPQQSLTNAAQSATSGTSLTIGTGSKTLAIQAGKAFQINQWVFIQETSAPANQMLGQVSAYSGTSLAVNVIAVGGSGTHSDWTIVLTNSAAAAGYQPPVGFGNVTGPGSSTAGHVVTFADSSGKILQDGGPPIGAANTITPSMLANATVSLGFNILNGAIVASATDANTSLTIAIKTLAGNDPSASDPTFFLFRSSIPGNASYSIIELAAPLSTKIPASSTLGFTNSTPGRFWIVAVNNGGAISLAVINCLSGTSIYPLAGWSVANITAYGGGANSAQVFYGSSTFASVPYSVIGFATYEVGSTLNTAGTWATTPSRMELYRAGVPLPGQSVQISESFTGAVATGTTQITYSDAIPTNIQGDQYMSQSITPASSANVLEVEAKAMASVGTAAKIQAALFQDNAINAMAATTYQDAGVSVGLNYIRWNQLAGTLAQTSFKLRLGTNAAATVTFNGDSGNRKYGGTMNSYMRVVERMS